MGFQRSHNAVLRQVQAVPDPESEEESTAGPDSALAGLNVTQTSIGMLAGLFDRLGARGVVKRIRVALTVAQKRRVVLLNTITGLDPEGAGADYADSLADTVPMYTDEVAGIQRGAGPRQADTACPSRPECCTQAKPERRVPDAGLVRRRRVNCRGEQA